MRAAQAAAQSLHVAPSISSSHVNPYRVKLACTHPTAYLVLLRPPPPHTHRCCCTAGSRQLFLGDVQTGIKKFQVLFDFLAYEVVLSPNR